MYAEEKGEEVEDAEIVFPIPAEGIRYKDAVSTAFAFNNSELVITGFDADGNGQSNDLYVALLNIDEDRGFQRAKLIDLIIEELGDEIEPCSPDDEIIFAPELTESWTEEIPTKVHK